MRAEAISWDDWSVSNPPPITDDDKWHVEFEPNEVKIVSLEQLDDLFRLSIVDSETKVWQAGMSDWQPLRVIAGLEEQPAPAPKRAPPKPPTPPTRSAAPSVRPPAPAPRSATPSVRPPAPAPRSIAPAPPSVRPPAPAPRLATSSVRPTPPPARPEYVAPASFYPEPIQAAPSAYPPAVAYAAPIAFAAPVHATNSVRPLVVSHAPPVTRGGSGFGRFLVGLSLVAGVSITAYRNDFLRDGAHAAHQDALYARLESALGGPAFGTLRALEQRTAAEPSIEASSSIDAPIRTAVTQPSLEAPSTPTPATGTTPPPVVSLESLAPEKKGQQAAAAPVVTPPPARAAESFAEPKAAATHLPAKASPAKALPVKAPPTKAAAAPKAAVERPAPVAQKPASEMSERERLNAAIGQSMMQSAAPKAKGKKSKASEYDPLNPSL